MAGAAREDVRMPDILEFVRACGLPGLGFLELLSALLEVLEPDETDRALLERVLHGIILPDETV